ncbi:valine--tRNA ligase [Aureimonas endophytica]|uniref:Valine--tRNA ligase n=1 Tax=Aureimonas endophytica TaxID=2027858 RepID=A0A916ZBW3_9HYPH|nr:valine--tRNA ligase [Aureimonas endophytica]GGD87064.1 valine--tRNA ligase [Aureimonas endophytica]
MIEKTYDAAAIEPRIAERWDEAAAFRAGAGARPGAEPFSIVIPPPNVTGSLHIGHALNNTLQDVLVRFERMRGKNVLWQPGMDHAGIATQMVVERQLMERQEPSRRRMGREAFVERVWQWKGESGGMILGQLRRLGASCDWTRERFTMDEGLSRAVRQVFVDLYRKGLIYKDKRLVNWDPVFQTAISDLEVEQREMPGKMWSFAYPLADGPVDGVSEIVISTTRPETMLGDGAVAVHPSDERYRHLVGRMVRLPIAERLIPIIADEYPDPEFGTGAVKITGAHDFNDFEVARRHDIPLIALMDAEARMISTPENNVPARFAGLDRYEAREMVVREIEELGLLRGIEEKVIAQPFGDRSNVVIEPMLTDQWYVDAATLAKPAIASVREGRTVFVPKNWEKTYFEWMENIQPWCISRQLWWGHQIPAWYGPDGEIFVAASEEEAVAAALAHYVTNGTIDDAEARRLAEDPAARDGFLTRDEDVLDTWFSSGLWPFSTLGWPDKTPELSTYYPTSVLVTGFDIIFFWVARMMMMGLHCMGEEPFGTVYVHALVRDKHGAKMSKSKGNVVDPLELIEEYGADALRFTLAIMAAQGRDVKLDPQRIAGYRNFGTKLWNATRFAEMNGVRHGEAVDPAVLTLPQNRWLLTELSRAIAETTEALEAFRFNDAAGALYRFVWNILCDWYVELSKPVYLGEDEAAKAETRRVTGYAIDQVLALLHPFMPFLTEELWTVTASAEAPRRTLLCHAEWPGLDYRDEASAADINWLVDLVSQIRSVRTEMNVPPGTEARLVAVQPDAEARRRLEGQGASLRRLARLATIEMAEAPPPASVQIVLGAEVFALPLEGMIDIAAETERLGKAIAKSDAEIARIEKKLSNERFVAGAPAEVVAEEREKLAGYRLERDKLVAARERLRG